MKTSAIGHTLTVKPFTNKNIEIHLFGRNGGTTDWSTRDLNAETHKKPTTASMKAFLKLQSLSAAARIQTIYAPHPAFNAQICDSSDLNLEFSSNDETMVEAEPPDNWSWSVHRGIEADGCDVPQKSAFWVSSADCPTLVVTDGERVICAHCGFRSLVNGPKMPRRQHYSVIDTVIKWFGSNPVKLETFIALGIGSHFPSTHSLLYFAIKEEEKISGGNAFITFVGQKSRLDMKKLVECQCHNRGIRSVHLDGFDTFSDRAGEGYTGEHLWWSYERAVILGNGTELCRNGVLVIHR